MGSGIAEIAARAGGKVLVVEADAAAMERGLERIERSLARAVNSKKMSESEGAEVRANLSFSTDFSELADRELVVEAVAEDESVKLEVFRKIDAAVEDPHAILATNTSSIPIIKLAMATQRPQQVIGLHFFNPVPVLKLVELISSLLTSAETTARARDYATNFLGKRVITSPDRAGFVVNALLIPYLLSAIRESRRHRHGHGRWLRAPHGSPGPDRSHWSRHHYGGRRVPLRGVQGTSLRATTPPLSYDPGGSARAQVGPGLLCLPVLNPPPRADET
jgi:3-hydroxyacyl-CoA dehydrogenase